MDRTAAIRYQRPFPIYGLAQDVKHTPQQSVTDGKIQRSAGICDCGAPGQTLG